MIMNEEDADESSAHELHHGANNPHRVRKFRKRVKKTEVKKVTVDDEQKHDLNAPSTTLASITGSISSDNSQQPKKPPNPRYQRGGSRQRRKKISPQHKNSIDGYENSGHENLSDFLFTDGDQSALEEESIFQVNRQRLSRGKVGVGHADETKAQSRQDTNVEEIVDEMPNLVLSANKDPAESMEDVEKNHRIRDTESISNSEPINHNDTADTKKKNPRKRRGRKKKHITPEEQIPEAEYDDAVHDPNEDEDDYPPDIASHSVTPVKNEDIEKEPTKPQASIRSLMEELTFLKRISSTKYRVHKGFVPNMKVSADIIVNDDLENLLIQELRDTCSCCDTKTHQDSSFIPALRQAANVAALPGIVKASFAMPDVHSGYGFCIGNVAAFDMDDKDAIISPGGVGFDINCGVRLIRTNLTEKDVDEKVREELAEALYRNIPCGVGSGGGIPCTNDDLDKLLETGVDWAIENGFAWKEDKIHCEENGKMSLADSSCVSARAKKRGRKQLGSLGAGNHYAEVQIVDEIYHPEAAKAMGINTLGQVCIMIHTGSRGLGHQVATEALIEMDKAMARDKIELNDRQLSCARISSREGKAYLAAMSAAANFAWVNRSCITYLARKAFSEVFKRDPDDLDMHLIYDVCHNIAKVEKHVVDGEEKTLLVHRKGSTRAFPPHHPSLPDDYKSIGQPVLIGGTMGTCSYVLVGTDRGMKETFGSTCHGAGRALSRNQSRKKLNHEEVLDKLKENGISIRVASPKLVTEEAPESYKDVCEVIETCEEAGISQKVVRLKPIAVIKG